MPVTAGHRTIIQFRNFQIIGTDDNMPIMVFDQDISIGHLRHREGKSSSSIDFHEMRREMFAHEDKGPSGLENTSKKASRM